MQQAKSRSYEQRSGQSHEFQAQHDNLFLLKRLVMQLSLILTSMKGHFWGMSYVYYGSNKKTEKNVLISFLFFVLPPFFKVNGIGVGSWHPWTLHFLITFFSVFWRLIKPLICFDRLLAWTANKFCGKLVCSHSKVFLIFTIRFLQLSEIKHIHIHAFRHIVSCIFVANCLSWELENGSNLKKWEKVCWWSLSEG